MMVALGACGDATSLARPVPSRAVAAESAATAKMGGGAPIVKPLNLQYWWDCASWDGMQTWSCTYVGTSGTPDYDPGLHPGDMYGYLYTQDCSTNPGMCPTSGGYSTGGDYGLASPSLSQSDLAADAVPVCSPPPTDAKARAWCKGVKPDGMRLTRINDALSRMRSKGGICATLAAVADTLLSLPAGGVRIYNKHDDPAFSTFGGGAIPGGATAAKGGATGPKAWLVIQAEWTDAYWSPNHKTTATLNGETFTRDLQQVLAHELDHLVGNDHTDAAEAKTTNSEACSDL
jgi:hypothetical protein